MKGKVIIFLSVITCFQIRGQVLCSFSPYRNVTYASAGINNSFANATFGIARVHNMKMIKKQIIGLLDVSLPLTGLYFTRRSVRKAFQLDLVKTGGFRIPMLIASSSIFRKNRYFKVHDVTLEVGLSPYFTKGKYYFGIDLRYEFILLRHYKYSQAYLSEVSSHAKSHWEETNSIIGKAGIVCGLDLKKWFFQFKCGYEKYPSVINQLIPAYAVLGGGFKFGTKRPLQ